jgi:hypothetical protein
VGALRWLGLGVLGLAALVALAPLGEGFAASEIAAIMGGNSVAYLRVNLPAR